MAERVVPTVPHRVVRLACSKCGGACETTHRYCRRCQAAYMRAWRAEGNEQMTEEHVRRDRVRSLAYAAMRRGQIQQTPCECGSTDDLEMHHDDYDKPLEVRFLCRPCHLLLPKDELLGAAVSCGTPA